MLVAALGTFGTVQSNLSEIDLLGAIQDRPLEGLEGLTSHLFADAPELTFATPGFSRLQVEMQMIKASEVARDAAEGLIKSAWDASVLIEMRRLLYLGDSPAAYLTDKAELQRLCSSATVCKSQIATSIPFAASPMLSTLLKNLPHDFFPIDDSFMERKLSSEFSPLAASQEGRESANEILRYHLDISLQRLSARVSDFAIIARDVQLKAETCISALGSIDASYTRAVADVAKVWSSLHLFAMANHPNHLLASLHQLVRVGTLPQFSVGCLEPSSRSFLARNLSVLLSAIIRIKSKVDHHAAAVGLE